MSYRIVSLGAFGIDCPMGQQPSNDGMTCEDMASIDKEEYCFSVGGTYYPETNECEYVPTSEDSYCVSSGGVVSDPITQGCICPAGTVHRLPPGDCVVSGGGGGGSGKLPVPSYTGQAGVTLAPAAKVAAVAGIGLVIYAIFG